jgi:hypothetical protein
MKLNRDDLVGRLDPLKPAIRTGGPTPELGYLWFDGKHARAYDGIMGISADMETDFALGAPGTALMGLIGSHAGKEIDLSADEPVTHLTVKMGKSSAKLAALADDQLLWPFDKKPVPKKNRLVMTEKFIDALERALLVRQPKGAQRTEFLGVAVYPVDGGGIDMVVTDSRTLVHTEVDDMEWPWGIALLPRAFAEQVSKQCKAGDTILAAPDYLTADAKGVTLYSAVMNVADMVDLTKAADEYLKDQQRRTAIPAGLADTLNRAMLLAGAQESAVVRLTLNGADLAVEGHYKQGDLHESLPLTKKDKKADVVAVTVEANLVYPLLGGLDELSLSERALALYGDGVLYLVASKS